MPYCRKCGAQLPEGARYCTVCGTLVSEAETRPVRRGAGINVAKILLLVFGGITLLAGLGLLIGGIALYGVNTSLVDREGFLATRPTRLQTNTYAIVFQRLDINLGEAAGGFGVWRPSPRDFITIRLSGYSNIPGEEIFIGIARESDAASYLSNVRYDEVVQARFSSSGSLQIQYVRHQGIAVPSSPTSQAFWVASKHGDGTQTLDWSPETGNYWIILMNEDGSLGVDLTMTLGAKVPLLSTISTALLAGGVVALVVGGFLLYLGIRR